MQIQNSAHTHGAGKGYSGFTYPRNTVFPPHHVPEMDGEILLCCATLRAEDDVCCTIS